MLCNKCGERLSESDLYCPNCGTKVIKNVVSNAQKKNNSATILLIILIIFWVFVFGVITLSSVFVFKFIKNGFNEFGSYMTNTFDIDNGSFNFDVEFSALIDEEKVNFKINSVSDVDFDSKSARVNVDIVGDEINTSILGYLDFYDDAILYFNVPETIAFEDLPAGWNKIVLGDINFDSDTIEKNFSFKGEFKDFEFIRKVDSTYDIDCYVIHFDSKAISDIKSHGYDTSSIEGSVLEQGVDMSIFVNKKDKYISKVSFDFSNVSYDNVYFEKFIFSLELSNINQVGYVVIPDEVMDAHEIILDNSTGIYNY